MRECRELALRVTKRVGPLPDERVVEKRPCSTWESSASGCQLSGVPPDYGVAAMQAAAEVEPVGATVPAGHAVHEVCVSAAVLYVLTGHVVQALATEGVASTLMYVPAAQVT